MPPTDDPLGTRPQDEEDPSIAGRAENGEHEEEPEEPEPPMEGDTQLSLNVGASTGNRNARKVKEATLRLMGGKRAVSGLLDIDTEYDLVVRVQPHAPAPLEKRNSDTGKVEAFDLDQRATVLHIRRADEAAVRDLFTHLLDADAAAAGKLLDELQAAMRGDVAAAA